MTEKLDSTAVERYSYACAQKMLDGAFAARQELSGKDLLTLTPVPQVNLFVLRELLEIWKGEALRLRSPYFNYEAKEVKESLGAFMNTLSNHIAVRKDDLLPIANKAVARTLFLVLNPYDYFSSLVGTSGVTADSLRSELRYIRINPAPLQRLAEEAGKHAAGLNGKEALARLDRILEEVAFSPEDVEPHLNQFNAVHPLDLKLFYRVIRDKRPKEAAPARTTAEPPRAAPPPPDRPTLADTFQRRRVQTIRDSLSINQKFMFTKVLFDGDFEAFNNAITSLDACDSLESANQLLERSYPGWNKEAEEYLEFFEILSIRFAN
jgi:hypothetical protein